MNITKGELIKISSNDIINYIVVISEIFNNYIICKKLYSQMPMTSEDVYYNYKNETNIVKDNTYIINNISLRATIKTKHFDWLDDITDATPLKIQKKQIQLIIQ
jgi:hypothetical protein